MILDLGQALGFELGEAVCDDDPTNVMAGDDIAKALQAADEAEDED